MRRLHGVILGLLFGLAAADLQPSIEMCNWPKDADVILEQYVDPSDCPKGCYSTDGFSEQFN